MNKSNAALLLACAFGGACETVTPPDANVDAETLAATEDAPEERLIGLWRSDACGSRTFARVIRLDDGGDLRAADRVAPCPARQDCPFRGIYDRSGKWALDDDRIVLDVESGISASPRPAFPRDLELFAGVPVERAENGAVCVYRRVSEDAS